MTHFPMRPRFASIAVLVFTALLVLASLTGCSTVRGWAQGGSGHSPTAGATVSLPLGK